MFLIRACRQVRVLVSLAVAPVTHVAMKGEEMTIVIETGIARGTATAIVIEDVAVGLANTGIVVAEAVRIYFRSFQLLMIRLRSFLA